MAVADGTTSPSSRTWGSCPTCSTTAPWPRSVGRPAPSATPATARPGSTTWRNAQPVYRDVGRHQFALGHNGNLTNTEALADDAGMLPGIVTQRQRPDGRAAGPAHDGHRRRPGRRAREPCCPRSRAPSRWCCSTTAAIIGVRDPNGFRPLCLGRLDGRLGAGSETPALDIVGAQLVRELEPGEIVVIDGDGPRSHPALRRPSGIDPHAVPVRVRLLRPARRPALRPQRGRGPGPHGRAAGRAGAAAARRPSAPSGRRWSCRCPRAGCRRPRASPGPAASPTATAW